jgi:hypothetical protein
MAEDAPLRLPEEEEEETPEPLADPSEEAKEETASKADNAWNVTALLVFILLAVIPLARS